uniref:Signal recognition particle 19 kDa protein n=1 Tax=Rhizochromulina marina TaxID=1034831 RepID=A0A7S2SLH7_9STRA|mmetsp:Transcript_31613/g.91901  ORF Transcript_31613/g.91901 Transcript_31613/m.91901 type:complete len:196 (+) Transcript_31613:313-900(+)
MSSKRGKNKAKKAAQAQLAAAQNAIPPGEEIYHTPVAPDPNTKITWPQSLAGKIDDSRFLVIWTININRSFKLSEGRRIPIASACEDPIVAEMSEVLQHFKLTHVIEPFKVYPRVMVPGRVRVKLIDDEDQPCNPEVPTRRVLMMRMGELIPKLKIRSQRIAMQQQRLAAAAEAHQAQQASSAAKKKGKGKKGKR